MGKEQDYQPLEAGGGSLGAASMRLQAAQRIEKRAKRFLYISSGLLIASVCVLIAATVVRRPSMMECDKMVSPWSSLWPAVEYWEGDLINFFNHTSIYRGPPTLERETAWNSLWYHHAMPVTKDGIYALNRTNPDLYYEVIDSDPEEPIYGGIAEVFHQLHCLNLIRQHSWPIELFDKDWGELYPDFLYDNPVLGRMHVDHCIEAIRLSLMCYSDITPVLNEHYDDPNFDRKADFNTHHQCRNFDKIAEYVETMGYDIPPPKSIENFTHPVHDTHQRRFVTPTKPRKRN